MSSPFTGNYLQPSPVIEDVLGFSGVPGSDPAKCPHIATALADDGERASLTKRFRAAVSWNARRSHDAIHASKRRKLSAPECGTCGVTLHRPLVCLSCGYAACWNGEHATEHLADEGHAFCVDVKLGAVFCTECDDFIYDATLDEIYHATVLDVEEKSTKFQVAKRRREPYRSWRPSSLDSAALEETTNLPCQGRRGLLNLGQTCFLNVILQSIVHNPLLRNYFLSDKHNSKQCKTKNCTCCEMDNLFTEIYTPSSTPYGPTSLLSTTWRVATDISGYAQQDAHECFIALLTAIHETSRGRTNVSCNCVVHNTFAGQLQSDVKCERCGNVTSTLDPCLDVSLTLEGGKPNTLDSCLKRFTTPERLASKEYACQKCAGKQTNGEASKRLSIKKLPPVLSFQFKRFEHKSLTSTSAQKIDAPVRIPASINMAPYTTLALSAPTPSPNGVVEGPNKLKAKIQPEDALSSFSYPGPEAMYEYDLFAVINHEGQIDNGHYTNFARFHDEWYRFDDDKVIPSTLPNVLNPPAPVYMAFYVKRRLDYKPDMTPTYILARETEAQKEKERERLEKEKKDKEAASSTSSHVNMNMTIGATENGLVQGGGPSEAEKGNTAPQVVVEEGEVAEGADGNGDVMDELERELEKAEREGERVQEIEYGVSEVQDKDDLDEELWDAVS